MFGVYLMWINVVTEWHSTREAAEAAVAEIVNDEPDWRGGVVVIALLDAGVTVG